MAALTKSILVEVPSSEAHVEVSISQFNKAEIVSELLRLNALNDEEAELLSSGESLSEHYTAQAREIRDEAEDRFTGDTRHIRSLIMARDAEEALIQLERMHRDFDGIVRLFERRA